MDLISGQEQEQISKLVAQLLSKDENDFNTAVNTYFAPHAQYYGHGLKLEGVSQIKHGAWLWHSLDKGQTASFNKNEIHWDGEARTANVPSTRYVRLKVLPLIGVVFPVVIRLHFKGKLGAELVQQYDEDWIVETVVRWFPIFHIFQLALQPLWTFIFITISELLFTAHSKVASLRPFHKAIESLPEPISAGLEAGFVRGAETANGWGYSAIKIIDRTSYLPLVILESSLQTFTLLISNLTPSPLPYPYIYDAHSISPATQQSSDVIGKISIIEGKHEPKVHSPPTQDTDTFGHAEARPPTEKNSEDPSHRHDITLADSQGGGQNVEPLNVKSQTHSSIDTVPSKSSTVGTNDENGTHKKKKSNKKRKQTKKNA